MDPTGHESEDGRKFRYEFAGLIVITQFPIWLIGDAGLNDRFVVVIMAVIAMHVSYLVGIALHELHYHFWYRVIQSCIDRELPASRVRLWQRCARWGYRASIVLSFAGVIGFVLASWWASFGGFLYIAPAFLGLLWGSVSSRGRYSAGKRDPRLDFQLWAALTREVVVDPTGAIEVRLRRRDPGESNMDADLVRLHTQLVEGAITQNEYEWLKLERIRQEGVISDEEYCRLKQSLTPNK